MVLDAIGWLLVALGALFFIFGAVGMFAPSVFKRPDEEKPPARWKFFLCAWLMPPLPLAIAAVILMRHHLS